MAPRPPTLCQGVHAGLQGLNGRLPYQPPEVPERTVDRHSYG